MTIPNRFERALNEIAFCSKHLTSKVSRNPKTGEWPKSCAYGGMQRKLGKFTNCSIIIEAKDGSYVIH